MKDVEIIGRLVKWAMIYGNKYGIEPIIMTEADTAQYFDIDRIVAKVHKRLEQHKDLFVAVEDQLKRNVINKNAQESSEFGGGVGGLIGTIVGLKKTYDEARQTWGIGKTILEAGKNITLYGTGASLIGSITGIVWASYVEPRFTTPNVNTKPVDNIREEMVRELLRNEVKTTLKAVIAKQPIEPKSGDKLSKKNFKCPITLALMEDPVLAPDGYSYERAALLEHYQSGRRNCPILRNVSLTPPDAWPTNHVLKSTIQEYLQLKRAREAQKSHHQRINQAGSSSQQLAM